MELRQEPPTGQLSSNVTKFSNHRVPSIDMARRDLFCRNQTSRQTECQPSQPSQFSIQLVPECKIEPDLEDQFPCCLTVLEPLNGPPWWYVSPARREALSETLLLSTSCPLIAIIILLQNSSTAPEFIRIILL